MEGAAHWPLGRMKINPRVHPHISLHSVGRGELICERCVSDWGLAGGRGGWLWLKFQLTKFIHSYFGCLVYIVVKMSIVICDVLPVK